MRKILQEDDVTFDENLKHNLRAIENQILFYLNHSERFILWYLNEDLPD